jgi:hypothetical protein
MSVGVDAHGELRDGWRRARLHASAVYTPAPLLRRRAAGVLRDPHLRVPAHEHLYTKWRIRQLSVRQRHRGHVRVSLNGRCPLNGFRSAVERESTRSKR